ncbi:MAG: integrin alpha [Planctomycetota bacterium]
MMTTQGRSAVTVLYAGLVLSISTPVGAQTFPHYSFAGVDGGDHGRVLFDAVSVADQDLEAFYDLGQYDVRPNQSGAQFDPGNDGLPPFYPYAALTGAELGYTGFGLGGDADGDGRADIAVTNYRRSMDGDGDGNVEQNTEDRIGWVRVFGVKDTPSGPRVQPIGGRITIVDDTTVTPTDTARNSLVAHTIQGIGDLDGDGRRDLMIGNALGNSQRVSVYAFSDRYNMDPLDTTERWVELIRIEPSTTQTRFGWKLEDIGDLNGDGQDDILLGAKGWNDIGASGVDYGAVFAFFMPPAVENTVGNPAPNDFWEHLVDTKSLGAATVDQDNDGIRDPIKVDADTFFSIKIYDEGLGASNIEFGNSVSRINDIDQDGQPEIAIGAPLFRPNGVTDAGEVFIYLSRSKIRSCTDSIQRFNQMNHLIDINTTTGEFTSSGLGAAKIVLDYADADYRIQGTKTNQRFGATVTRGVDYDDFANPAYTSNPQRDIEIIMTGSVSEDEMWVYDIDTFSGHPLSAGCTGLTTIYLDAGDTTTPGDEDDYYTGTGKTVYQDSGPNDWRDDNDPKEINTVSMFGDIDGDASCEFIIADGSAANIYNLDYDDATGTRSLRLMWRIFEEGDMSTPATTFSDWSAYDNGGTERWKRTGEAIDNRNGDSTRPGFTSADANQDYSIGLRRSWPAWDVNGDGRDDLLVGAWRYPAEVTVDQDTMRDPEVVFPFDTDGNGAITGDENDYYFSIDPASETPDGRFFAVGGKVYVFTSPTPVVPAGPGSPGSSNAGLLAQVISDLGTSAPGSDLDNDGAVTIDDVVQAINAAE